MRLRPAEKQDYSAICALITSAEELFLIFPRGKYPFSMDQLQRLAQERMALTVMEDNKRIVGFANLYDHNPDEWIFIGNVVVEKQRRGEGLGKRIIEHMLDLAFTRYRVKETRISVFSNNLPALLMYSRFGFKPYDIEERVDVTNQRVALLHMRLPKSNWSNQKT